MWTDSHAHLDKLSEGAEAALREAGAASVHRILTIGTEPKDWPEVIRFSEMFNGGAFASADLPSAERREERASADLSGRGNSLNSEVSLEAQDGAFALSAQKAPPVLRGPGAGGGRRPLPAVYGALGMHPHTACAYDDKAESFLRKNLHRERIAAVGEIGLDYHYENSGKRAQREAFERQLNLAKEFQLPVEIHTRSAEEDTLFFLKKFQGDVRGLLHCFTGSESLAKGALDLGFNISFSGIITFKKTEALRETCRKVPLDRLHIETDCPFLAPAPNRGRENRPAWVGLVARTVAALHSAGEEALSRQLEKNTLDLFPKIKSSEFV